MSTELLEEVESLRSQLGRIGREPLAHAVVLSLNEGPASYEDFEEGMKVRWPGHPRHKGVGTIREIDRQARVSFMTGTETARIGHPDDSVCDVEPAGFKSGGLTLLVEGRRVEVRIPRDPALSPGDTVLVKLDTLQILRRTEPIAAGPTTVARRVTEHGVKVTVGSDERLVRHGFPVEEGDELVLDPSGHVAVKNLGPSESQFTLVKDTGVRWEHIGGQDEAKRTLREAISGRTRNPEIYARFRRKPVKGVLLYGAPGCGKTLLGKAAATQLAEERGESVGSGLIYIKGPEMLSKWVGESERLIRDLFTQARKHEKRHGFPAVIFLDEAEALLSERGTSRSSDVDKTIVPTFLSEMDGLDESGALVILATNRQDVLDPAVVRPGRVDRHVHVTRPDEETARSIFSIYLSGLPLNGATEEGLACLGTSALFSPDLRLYTIEFKDGTRETVRYSDLASGAVISGVVDMASERAMGREACGVSGEDVTDSVRRSFEQQHHLNHREVIEEKARGRDIAHVRKAYDGTTGVL